MRVTATATRTGQWWAIDVSDVAGGLHIDAVALVADVSPDAIEVDVIPRLPQAEAPIS